MSSMIFELQYSYSSVKMYTLYIASALTMTDLVFVQRVKVFCTV